jgi:hypothetical protein
LVKEIDLASRSVQPAMMVKGLQPPQQLRRCALCEVTQMRGAQKPVPGHKADDIPVSLCNLH